MLIVIIDTEGNGEAGRAAVDQALARVGESTPATSEQLEQAFVAGYEQAVTQVAPATYAYASVPMTAAPMPAEYLPYTPDPTDNLISPAADPFAPYQASYDTQQARVAAAQPSADEMAAWIEQQQREAIARVASAHPGPLSAIEPDTPDIPAAPVTPTTILSSDRPASSTVL